MRHGDLLARPFFCWTWKKQGSEENISGKQTTTTKTKTMQIKFYAAAACFRQFPNGVKLN